MLKQNIKYFREMSVTISHYLSFSLSKLVQSASDPLENWGRIYVQAILKFNSCLQMCKGGHRLYQADFQSQPPQESYQDSEHTPQATQCL